MINTPLAPLFWSHLMIFMMDWNSPYSNPPFLKRFQTVCYWFTMACRHHIIDLRWMELIFCTTHAVKYHFSGYNRLFQDISSSVLFCSPIEIWVQCAFWPIFASLADLCFKPPPQFARPRSELAFHWKSFALQHACHWAEPGILGWDSIYTVTGWWFGIFFIFPYIGKNHPNWLIFFRGVETKPTSIKGILTWLNEAYLWNMLSLFCAGIDTCIGRSLRREEKHDSVRLWVAPRYSMVLEYLATCDPLKSIKCW